MLVLDYLRLAGGGISIHAFNYKITVQWNKAIQTTSVRENLDQAIFMPIDQSKSRARLGQLAPSIPVVAKKYIMHDYIKLFSRY